MTFHTTNMFNSKYSTMDYTSSQTYENPNPNPNYDYWVTYGGNQMNDSTSFHDIANYLMSNDEDEASDENMSLESKDASRDHIMTNCLDGSAHEIKSCARREVKKCNEAAQGDQCRFAFRTKTDLEVMDDGYKWRKYGKKKVKNSPNPRNYYKCSSEGCSVKKRVERDRDDPSYVITTYEGVHNHQSPAAGCVFYCAPRPISLLHNTSPT